jgi:hypothetical protein
MKQRLLEALFWVHQAIFFLVSMGPVGELLIKGGTSGQLNVIPLLLAWIAGSLMFGLGAIITGTMPAKAPQVQAS